MDPMRFPIGEFSAPHEWSSDDLRTWIEDLARLPSALRAVAQPLKDSQLDTPYRPGGWTVRQLVHHVADSHLNGYIRFKWALTEDLPTIKAYHQDAWAALPDSKLPIGVSLDLLEAVCRRWAGLMRSLDDDAWQVRFDHPESGVEPLGVALALYRWHGRHHLAHVQNLVSRKGWDVPMNVRPS